MLTLQFSSGCPISASSATFPISGRQPRRTPAQVTAELDAMRKQKGHPPVVYFVGGNSIGNRRAAGTCCRTCSPGRGNGYPRIRPRATLNIAKRPEILSLMRECSFLGCSSASRRRRLRRSTPCARMSTTPCR